MDILQLKYFSQVYKQLNYTQAAQALYVSRQALQQSIRSLERELDCPLFTLKSGSLMPTRYGVLLYRESQRVLDDFAALESVLARELHEEEHKPVRTGTITNVHDVMTEKESVACHRHHFDSRDIHVTASSDELRALVAAGKLDIAFLYGDPALSRDFTRLVFDEPAPLWLAVPRDHPLARKDSVKAADLENLPFLGMGATYDIDKELIACCRDAGFDLLFTCTSPDTVRMLTRVSLGDGVTYWLTPTPPAANVVCVLFDEPRLFWSNYAIVAETPLEENPAYLRSRALWETVPRIVKAEQPV